MDLDQINRRYYEGKRAVAVYAAAGGNLETALVHILLKYRDAVAGQPVLDIGIGTGRTTVYLSRIAGRYEGIDYSASMVDHCRKRFPGVSVHHCDVRDLSRFADSTFSFAVFSYSGIDSIDHDGRLKALAEIARVLRLGGLCAFSARNRGWRMAKAAPRLRYSRNPLTQAYYVYHWLGMMRNHSRMRRCEYEGPEYALLNDEGEDYGLVHYYITREGQRAQLAEAGFDILEMYDKGGDLLDADADDSASASVWYVARRVAPKDGEALTTRSR